MKYLKGLNLNWLSYILVASLVVVLVQSCAVKKYIPEDELLYTGAEIEIKADSSVKQPQDLKAVLEAATTPKPNSTFLGMRPGLHYYYVNQKEKPGFLNRWLYKKFGEEPVYKSDVESYEVEDVLKNKLENNGFFYSTANSTFTDNEDVKESFVTYSVSVPTPYLIE